MASGVEPAREVQLLYSCSSAILESLTASVGEVVSYSALPCEQQHVLQQFLLLRIIWEARKSFSMPSVVCPRGSTEPALVQSDD